MSHTTKIQSVPIKSVDALRSAVLALKEMGVNCDLLENTKPRMFYRHQEELCEFVLKLHDCQYDLGFRLEQSESGKSYAPIFDEWGDYIAQHLSVGKRPQNKEDQSAWHIGKFLQQYSVSEVREEAHLNGWTVDEEVDESGEIHLSITGM